MHISHSIHVQHPVQEVSALLMESPTKWFPGLAGKNLTTVGIHVAGLPLRKKVILQFGEPVKTSTWAVLPLTWKATFPQKLFPVMTGKLEIAPVDKNETRLTISGMYEPPLGKLGEQLDEAVMRNVAAGTVKELAESIAQKLSGAAKA